MITIGIAYSVGNQCNEMKENVEVPNNFFKWSEDRQDEYLNTEKVINQITNYTSKMDSKDFDNEDEHIIHGVRVKYPY